MKTAGVDTGQVEVPLRGAFRRTSENPSSGA
jgi:hypothetical protein